MEDTNKIIINELTFTHILELGKIAVEKSGVPKEIVEKTLNRIASENNIAFYFV